MEPSMVSVEIKDYFALCKWENCVPLYYLGDIRW